MMSMLKCERCGGVYPEQQADGTVYFHACPESRLDDAGNLQAIADPRDENVAAVLDQDSSWTRPAGARPVEPEPLDPLKV